MDFGIADVLKPPPHWTSSLQLFVNGAVVSCKWHRWQGMGRDGSLQALITGDAFCYQASGDRSAFVVKIRSVLCRVGFVHSL